MSRTRVNVGSHGRSRREQHVAVFEPGIPPHPLPGNQRQRAGEVRTGIYTSVELAPLATGIDSLRQLLQQRRVKFPPGELRAQLGRVHASEDRAMAGPHEVPCQSRRVLAPDRKHPGPAERVQQRLTIGTHVGEEEVTKGRVPHSWPVRLSRAQGESKRRLVIGVAGARGN